jgi:hypothetical protein
VFDRRHKCLPVFKDYCWEGGDSSEVWNTERKVPYRREERGSKGRLNGDEV